MKIAVLANLKKDVPFDEEHPPGDEYWDDLDDPKTVRAVVRALRKGGHEAKYIAPNLGVIRRLLNFKPGLCFNFCEGHYGVSREAQMPAILDMLRLPYTGAGVLGMSLSHNKFMAKKVFHWVGLPTPDFILVNNPAEIPTIDFAYPLFVKPAHEGTSIGINENAKIWDYDSLVKQVSWAWSKVRAPILIEPYIEGREFTASVLGRQVLPIIEIISPTGYYSHGQKEDEKSAVYRVCPAEISEEKKQEIERTALEAMEALELHDWCRMDLRMDKDNHAYILEVNPLPLMFPDPEQASYVFSSQVAGYSYTEMVNKIVEVASERLGLKQ
ncbi:MAG: ATP-grasp domain-containing protein [Anaerolineaceae bacterium]|nr:ATP-grasp domain-containing protein [Anaerolineaceae bacterium]